MDKEDAEEFTQSLGLIAGGAWRQIKLAKRMGVPKALGLTVEQWVNDRLGGYIRMSIEDRREAVKELTSEGESTRSIAEVLGVGKSTVDRDLGAPSGALADGLYTQVADSIDIEKEPDNSTVPSGTPLDTIAVLTASEKVKETAEALGKREQKRQEHKELIRTMEWPKGKYRVISADPPWQYNDTRSLPGYTTTAAEDNYPTMTMEELCALRVKDIALDDSVLFLWTTGPLLFEAREVIQAWGFTYKQFFVWDKGAGSFGHYHNASAEPYILATRGSCTPDADRREDQVQFYPRGRHSEKPEAFREMIDRMYPYGPRIELFARGPAPKGWDVWGNEIIMPEPTRLLSLSG